MGRWTILEREVRHDFQTVARANRPGFQSHREGMKSRVPEQLIRNGKDLEWPREVEDLDFVEQKNGDVLFHAKAMG